MSNLPPGCTQDEIDRAHGYDGEFWPEEECCHEDYESDILTGRATCNMCDYSWWMTSDEIDAEHQRYTDYYEWERKERRREFWRKLTFPIRWPIYKILERIRPRRSCDVLYDDDEIPF